jgi:hypothetical protein
VDAYIEFNISMTTKQAEQLGGVLAPDGSLIVQASCPMTDVRSYIKAARKRWRKSGSQKTFAQFWQDLSRVNKWEDAV